MKITIEISPGIELRLSPEAAHALQYKLQLAMESTSAEGCSVTYGAGSITSQVYYLKEFGVVR